MPPLCSPDAAASTLRSQSSFSNPPLLFCTPISVQVAASCAIASALAEKRTSNGEDQLPPFISRQNPSAPPQITADSCAIASSSQEKLSNFHSHGEHERPAAHATSASSTAAHRNFRCLQKTARQSATRLLAESPSFTARSACGSVGSSLQMMKSLMPPQARHIPRSCAVINSCCDLIKEQNLQVVPSGAGRRDSRTIVALRRENTSLDVDNRGAAINKSRLVFAHRQKRSTITRCSSFSAKQISTPKLSFADVSSSTGSANKFGHSVVGSYEKIGSNKRTSWDLSKLDKLATIACQIAKKRRSPRKQRRAYTSLTWMAAFHRSTSHTNVTSQLAAANGQCDRHSVDLPESITCKKAEDNQAAASDLKRLQLKDGSAVHGIKAKHSYLKNFGHVLIKARSNPISVSSNISGTTHPADGPSLHRKKIKGAYRQETRVQTRVQRCARQVLLFVGKHVFSEKLIRQALGNNPDTSKALRLSLSQHKLRRFGGGGRSDPYIYKATPLGLEELTDRELEVSIATPVCS